MMDLPVPFRRSQFNVHDSKNSLVLHRWMIQKQNEIVS